jgi:DNA-binding MarR family transcriptional regulator
MRAAKSKRAVPRTGRPTDSAFREIIRVFGLLERIMQRHFARFGISGAQWGVLRNLHRAEEEGLAGLRLKDLGDRLLIRPPSVTGVVDRLERAGLVARTGSTTDLRAKQVALTSRGREIVERALQVNQQQVNLVMGGLNQGEQADLHRLLAKLGQHLYLLSNEAQPSPDA